jgi:hypothetical protein
VLFGTIFMRDILRSIRFPLALMILLSLTLVGGAQDFPDVCQQPENILRNCNFDNGLDHWQTFTEAGGAQISTLQGGGECHAPLCPAAYIVTDNHFVGGLYQQVPAVKGNSYYANIVWLVFDSLVNDQGAHQATGGIGRRIGLDPFGGSDSRSPNIVWSPDNWRNDCKICNIEQVTVTAQADTITLFLRIDDTWKLRAAEKGFPVPPNKDQFWIDDIGLKQVGGQALAVQAPVETPTLPPPSTDTPPPPPTSPPEPELPTNTPSPPTETPTLEAEPTDEVNQAAIVAEIVSPPTTPTSAYPNVPAIAPPPTLTPTPIPSPTPTFTRRPRHTPTPSWQGTGNTSPESGSPELPTMMGAVGVTACIGGAVLLVVGAVMAGLVWLYRLGWADAERDEVEATY